MSLLFDTSDWNFETLKRTYDAIEKIAVDEMGLDPYPNQVEVISSEQMLDATSSIGMPIFYHHWSFGKRFAHDEAMYRKGYSGLAYEIVINSNPCISYIMEENTMTMQTLVMAHAAFGHNHFFKNNYLFKEQTDAGGILDYLTFAKTYVARCEERYGVAAVERILDCAHALMDQGVNRYGRRARPSLAEERARAEARQTHADETYSDIWRTLPGVQRPALVVARPETDKLGLPEENLLYFLEKFSPKLRDWERELLRIVRNIAQYFFPQRQTKVMNEGCATYVHYKIMNRLYDTGQIGDGAMLEFLASHSAVVFQPDFDDPRYSGVNPYALGFQMMCDIERIVTDPTDEDREHMPEIAGAGNVMKVLKDAWANYRDDSFIAQYLSPRLMRKMRLFKLADRAAQPHYKVDAIHDARGYRDVRRALARQYDPGLRDPNIQVTGANLAGDRRLTLTHRLNDEVPLAERDAIAVLGYVADLWGFDVELVGLNQQDEQRYRFDLGAAALAEAAA
ncbi:SpoVR family protein [Phenylobacterium sp.]|jgi:spore cortex formation protein SpoVR/YcgB (stage V sporulation)|uniref:SpoVR family protein n=1 Tax=Phenylobacterium sp. TaxID=1871053 RepID=UPI002F41ABBF